MLAFIAKVSTSKRIDFINMPFKLLHKVFNSTAKKALDNIFFNLLQNVYTKNMDYLVRGQAICKSRLAHLGFIYTSL